MKDEQVAARLRRVANGLKDRNARLDSVLMAAGYHGGTSWERRQAFIAELNAVGAPTTPTGDGGRDTLPGDRGAEGGRAPNGPAAVPADRDTTRPVGRGRTR